MKFLYGDSWERHPIRDGETWADRFTGSAVTVCDILKGIPDHMLPADMIYCDPPWNTGNVNSFVTKAETGGYIEDFEQFASALFDRIAEISPGVCYLEIGKQNLDLFEREMNRLYPSVQTWEIRYYRKYPCYMVRGGESATGFDFTGMDDEKTPMSAILAENPRCVADLCAGRGLTAVAAHKAGIRFAGTELNRRRLAVAIDRVNKLGGNYEGPVS